MRTVNSIHHCLSTERLQAAGIHPGTFRRPAGIRDVEDLKEDCDQALKACQ